MLPPRYFRNYLQFLSVLMDTNLAVSNLMQVQELEIETKYKPVMILSYKYSWEI